MFHVKRVYRRPEARAKRASKGDCPGRPPFEGRLPAATSG